MAHFYGSMKGTRGQATRCGTKKAGIQAHVRGWKVGVKVQAQHFKHTGKEIDAFLVYATGGSDGEHPDRYLGQITLDDNGRPFFSPSGVK